MPNEFITVLNAEHEHRNDVLQIAVTRFNTKMQQIGRNGIDDLIPAERGDDTTITLLETIGDELTTIGTIVNTDWHPACTLFNREMRHAGIRRQEMRDVCAHPNGWALVWIQVH
jgi:phage-related minor tail protein